MVRDPDGTGAIGGDAAFVEYHLELNAGLYGVVDFKNYAFGAVFAVLRLVPAADTGEGVQDMDDSVARGGEVALKVRGVKISN